MKIAVDTSVLLDVLAGDSTFGPSSREALRRAYDSGSLLASDVVWSEVRAHFESEGSFEAAMNSLGLQYLPLSDQAARLAGSHWRRYHQGRSRPRLSAQDVSPVAAQMQTSVRAIARQAKDTEIRSKLDKFIKEKVVPQFLEYNITAAGTFKNNWLGALSGGNYGENYWLRSAYNLAGIWANSSHELSILWPREMRRHNL